METTETTSELVQLVKTSGLEVTKQNQIAETLGVFFHKASEWDATIKSIVITSPEETGKMKMAKEGRLTLKGMRLEAEKIVRTKRDEVKYRMSNDVLEDKLWLKAGQMMEATFKNLETKLEEKEKFAERWEAEQKEKLKQERLALLLPLGFQFENGFDLGNMDEQMFKSLKLGLETAKKEKEEAEQKAEEERIAKEKAIELHNQRKDIAFPYYDFWSEYEKTLDFGLQSAIDFNCFIERIKNAKANHDAEQARIKLENEKLKVEAEKREKEIEAERIANEKKLAEERLKVEIERKRVEEEERKKREEIEAKLKAEAEAKAKLEAELKAKKDAEEKIEADRKERERIEEEERKKQLLAPDKEKLNHWIDNIMIGLTPDVGAKGHKVALDIHVKFDAFKKWAKEQIETI